MFHEQSGFFMHIPISAMETFISTLPPSLLYLVLDQDESIVRCNPSFLHIIGYPLEEVKGRPLRELSDISEPIVHIYDTFFHAEFKGNLPFVKFRTKNGVMVSADFMLFALRLGDQMYHVMILKHLQFPKLENGLLERFSNTFMRDVNLGVLLIDPDFKLIEISDMACRIFGTKRELVLNHPVEALFGQVPEMHQFVSRSLFEGIVVRNQAVSWINEQERYELLMDSNLLRDDSGAIVGGYVIFKDVTNLRSLEQQVQRNDRLAMIGQIAAGTAHEIRNPLTSIKGFLQMFRNTLLERGLMREHSYTEIMLTEINRINDLLTEFLLLSKPKNTSYEKIKVSSVIREILPIINNEAILHGISVNLKSCYELPAVIADRELLKQVFLNLCKNAIEAMSEGGTLSIVEKVDESSGMVNIEVHDTGPGIPSYIVDKIFDPFFTTKEEGTGLGLSVCQRIIHDLGGTIRVVSKGFGTTFIIGIPIAHN